MRPDETVITSPDEMNAAPSAQVDDIAITGKQPLCLHAAVLALIFLIPITMKYVKNINRNYNRRGGDLHNREIGYWFVYQRELVEVFDPHNREIVDAKRKVLRGKSESVAMFLIPIKGK